LFVLQIEFDIFTKSVDFYFIHLFA